MSDFFAQADTLILTLLSGNQWALDPAVIESGPDHALYARVHGRHAARLLRGAHQRLLDTAVAPNVCIVDSIRIELRPREDP